MVKLVKLSELISPARRSSADNRKPRKSAQAQALSKKELQQVAGGPSETAVLKTKHDTA